jgi:peroxisomal 2,4-dienoyl-CoA reductase
VLKSLCRTGLSTNGFRTVLDIDAVGTFNVSRAAHAALCAASGACIVNISATLHYGATWYQAHACAAKAAVDALTRSLALEWGAAGIRVCGVAPGPISGTAGMAKLAPPTGEGAAGASRAADEAMARVTAEIPLGRMGSKVDIALAVVFLLSDAAAFVTGETLVVDGGAWLYRTPAVPRAFVAQASRKAEGASRAVGLARPMAKL